MRNTYDPEVDAFCLYLGTGSIAESTQVRPGIVFDLDADGRLLGIEVLYASVTSSKDMHLTAMGRP